MSEEKLEDDEASIDAEDLDEAVLEEADDLDDDLDDDLVIDPDVAVDVIADDVVVEDETVARVVEAPVVAPKGDDDDDEVVDLDEELHPDDVETPLDALLEEKTAAQKMEDEEEDLEEEEPESSEPGDGPARIVPRRPGEFLCSSCFLVLPRNQLQDKERMLCRDCA
ncbi:MAG: DUF4193 family protein [Acidimicrobiia bacterium]